MNALPHGLTEPLHILGPSPWPMRLLVLALVLGALLVWVLAKRPRPRAAARTSVPPPPPPPPAGGPLADALAALRLEHLVSGRYREGCHALSELLRGHLERSEGKRYLTLTAREIARRKVSSSWSRLLTLLAELQFARRGPARGDFEGICDLAAEVAARATGDPR